MREFPTVANFVYSSLKAPESGALQRLRQVRWIKGREAYGVRCIPPLFIETEKTCPNFFFDTSPKMPSPFGESRQACL
jgi:hypothetical protein